MIHTPLSGKQIKSYMKLPNIFSGRTFPAKLAEFISKRRTLQDTNPSMAEIGISRCASAEPSLMHEPDAQRAAGGPAG
jgi:hypothetical protein